MNHRESMLYIAIFLFLTLVVFLLFAYAHLEKVKDTTNIIQHKVTPEELLKDKYGAVTMVRYLSKPTYVFKINNIAFFDDCTLRQKLNGNTCLEIDLLWVVQSVCLNKYFLITISFMALNYIFLYYNVVYKRRIEEKQKAFIENRLQFQTTMILTENLHHELNTPLVVISNKVKKMAGFVASPNATDLSMYLADYKAVDAGITIIRDILDRLKSVKHLKVYETKRTLYEIVKSSCEMVKISNSDMFDYTIDEKLKEYKANGAFMKNGELSGILLNHIKNSVEADATSISFKFGSVDSNNKCSFYIGDNGNGIPKKITKMIFNEDFSSKNGIRGNGLYINKFLIENAKGSLKLLSTSSEGTAFQLNIPVVSSTEEEIEKANADAVNVVKKLESDIISKDNLIQQLLDSLPDMVWLKDTEGKYVVANKAIKEGLLFDEEPLGKGDIEIAIKAKERFGLDNHTFGEKCANSDIITLEAEEPSRFLESGKIKGEMMYLEVYKNIIRDIEGKIIGVCGAGRDLTEYIDSIRKFEASCGSCASNIHLKTFDKYKFGDECDID